MTAILTLAQVLGTVGGSISDGSAIIDVAIVAVGFETLFAEIAAMRGADASEIN